MHGVALLLTVAAIGVEYGWQPGEDGQLEYIIQIEPELVKTLSEGKVDLVSEIPEELQGVRRFRIRVGTGAVPREGLERFQANQVGGDIGVASQPPNLNSRTGTQGDTTRAGTGAVRMPGDTRGSPTQPGARALNPPGDTTSPQTGGAFPAVGNTPGINRSGSTSRDRFGNPTTDPADPTEPLNDRSPLGFENTNTGTGTGATTGTRTPGATTGTQPVWDAATGQWRTPRPGTDPGTKTGSGFNNAGTGINNGTNTGTGVGTNPLTNPQNTGVDNRAPATQDPRYNNDPRYANDPRYQADPRTATQDPRYTPYAPNAYPQNGYNPPANQNNQWGPPNYQAPVRDPDQPYYPPSQYAGPTGQYDPNQPNRQVGYQVAANNNPNSPNGTNAATGTQPNVAGATTAATATKPAAAVNTRDLNRYGDETKPWWPLTFTAMLLFASVGLNFYLGWIAHGIYQRYRALLMEVRNVRTATI